VRLLYARMQLTLRRARERRRLTIAQLADMSGVHKSTVSRIERGETKPLHETAVALEAALDVKRGTLRFDQPDADAAA
jgi:transcriptional regulator with XRE-family HTH domain